MIKKLIIFGTGQIAEIAKDCFEKQNKYEISCFCADKESIKNHTFLGKPLLSFEDIEKNFSPEDYHFHVAISYREQNKIREIKFNEAKDKGYYLASYISENSQIDIKNDFFGENCLILDNQTIQKNVKIGSNVMIWSGNHIGHETTIDDHTYISSHVVISGNCKIGKRVFFGVNSSVADHTKIGDECFIGMGATVTKNMKVGETAITKSTQYLDADDRSNILIKKNFFK